jgi:hypothetical protein
MKDTRPNFPSVQSRYIVTSARVSHPNAGRHGRPLPKLIYRPHLRDGFSGVMNFTVIRTKAVYAPKDKGKPATKFGSSHFHLMYYT